ncbi:MAG TPA: hypothetical protein VI299_09040 [Polyangiales bacterium]
MSGPHVLTGKVVSRQGSPVPDARVFFVDGPGPFPEIAALSDAAGLFSLSAPQDGLYVVACATDAGSAARASVLVPTTQQVVLVV